MGTQEMVSVMAGLPMKRAALNVILDKMFHRAITVSALSVALAFSGCGTKNAGEPATPPAAHKSEQSSGVNGLPDSHQEESSANVPASSLPLPSPLPPPPSPQPPVQDTTAPIVSDAAPVSGAMNVLSWELVGQKKNISVVFSEHVDLSTVTTGSLVLDPPAVVESVGIASSQVVHFTLSALEPATSYQVTFKKNGVKDFSGNFLANDFQWQFKTIVCGNGYGQMHCPQPPADNAQIEVAPSGGGDIQMTSHASSWVGEEYIIRPIGTGRLDTDKVVTCPDHYGVVEMMVRGGEIIDQVTRIGCRNIFHLDPNDHSPAAAVKYMDVSIGGGGGGEVTFKPYDNHVFTGWWTKTVPWDGAPGYFVGEFVPMASPVLGHLGVVSVINQQMSGGMSSIGNAGGDGSDYSYVPTRCPKGYFIKGVIGADDQSGYVKRLGAVCQRLAILGQPSSGEVSLYDGSEFGPLEGPGLGGAAGGYFRADCPAGKVIVSLEGRRGDVWDALTKIHCKAVDENGHPTGAIEKVDVIGGGGAGGGDFSCSMNDRSWTGWWIKRRLLGGNWVIGQITWNAVSANGICGAGLGPTANDGKWEADENGNPKEVEFSPTTHGCPSGYVLTGLKGLAGDYVSSLGGICHKRGH